MLYAALFDPRDVRIALQGMLKSVHALVIGVFELSERLGLAKALGIRE